MLFFVNQNHIRLQLKCHDTFLIHMQYEQNSTGYFQIFSNIFSWKNHSVLIHKLCKDVSKVKIWLNTLRPRQNGRRFADNTFKCIFLNENVRISIKISLKFVPKDPINNPALVQIMAWHWSGHKPLPEPMMVSLLTHICVTRPQWVKRKPGHCRLTHWGPESQTFTN